MNLKYQKALLVENFYKKKCIIIAVLHITKSIYSMILHTEILIHASDKEGGPGGSQVLR